jgi:hypothetical protein
LLGQSGEKYFDYFVFNIVDFFQLKFGGLCGAFVHVDYSRIDSATPWFVSTEACHARGARHRALFVIDSVCIDLDRADHVTSDKS